MGSRRSILISLATLLVAALPAVGRGSAANEYQVKAAFLYHFVEFTEWPSSAFANKQAPIVVATLGADPFHGSLEQACAGKSISGRMLVVKHFSKATDVRDCQVLFIASGSDDEFPTALAASGPAGLLTVGETERFMSAGGIIRFYEEDNRVRFEINSAAAARAHLQISAKLLRLAKSHGG